MTTIPLKYPSPRFLWPIWVQLGPLYDPVQVHVRFPTNALALEAAIKRHPEFTDILAAESEAGGWRAMTFWRKDKSGLKWIDEKMWESNMFVDDIILARPAPPLDPQAEPPRPPRDEPEDEDPDVSMALIKLLIAAPYLFKDKPPKPKSDATARCASGTALLDYLSKEKLAEARPAAAKMCKTLLYSKYILSVPATKNFEWREDGWYKLGVCFVDVVSGEVVEDSPGVSPRSPSVSPRSPRGGDLEKFVLVGSFVGVRFSVSKMGYIVQQSDLKGALKLLLSDSPEFSTKFYNEFISLFLWTFPVFMKPIELLQFLLERYHTGDFGLHKRILQILYEWTEIDNGLDFECIDVRSQFLRFLKEESSSTDGRLNLAMLYFKVKLEHIHNQLTFPAPHAPSPDRIDITSIYDPKDVAIQMTLIMESYFWRTSRVELMLRKLSNNWTNIITFSNHISGWVVAEILKEPSVPKQMAVFSFFLRVSEELKALNNFLCLGSVINGLKDRCLMKLTKVQKELPKTYMSSINNLLSLIMGDMDERNDPYKKIFDSVIQSNQPFIPYIYCNCFGISNLTRCCSDTYFLSSSEGPEGWINWSKLMQIRKIIPLIKSYKIRYNLTPNQLLQNAILNAESWALTDGKFKLNCQIALLRDEFGDKWRLTYPPKEDTSSIWTNYSLEDSDWLIINQDVPQVQCKRNDVVIGVKEEKSHKSMYQLINGVYVYELGGLPKTLRSNFQIKTPYLFIDTFWKPPRPGVLSVVKEGSYYELKKGHLMFLFSRNVVLGRKFFFKIAKNLSIKLLKKLKRPVKREFTQESPSKNTVTNSPLKFSSEEPIFCDESLKISYSKEEFTNLVLTYKRCIIYDKLERRNKRESTLDLLRKVERKSSNQLRIKFSSFSSSIGIEGPEQKINSLFEVLNTLSKKEEISPLDVNPIHSFKLLQEEWELILNHSNTLKFKTGDVIFKEGDPNERQLFFVLSGSVTEKSKIPVDYKDKDFFGVMSFYHPEPHQLKAEATSPSEVALLEPFYLNILFQHYPFLSLKFFYYLSKQLHKNISN